MSYYLDKSVEECKLKNDSWIYCKETVDGKNCDISEEESDDRWGRKESDEDD